MSRTKTEKVCKHAHSDHDVSFFVFKATWHVFQGKVYDYMSTIRPSKGEMQSVTVLRTTPANQIYILVLCKETRFRWRFSKRTDPYWLIQLLNVLRNQHLARSGWDQDSSLTRSVALRVSCRQSFATSFVLCNNTSVPTLS